MSKPKYIIGSVSCATHREEDSIPRFLDAIEYFSKSRARSLRKELREIEAIKEEDEKQDQIAYFLNETLFDVLNEYAAPFMYFGAHPGDGADFGFWLFEDWGQQLKDDGGIKVSDLSELPRGFTGYACQVSDHGNPTLYNVTNGKARELWSLI